MRIAFFELEEWEKAYFEKEFINSHELFFFEKPLTQAELPQIKDVDALVVFVHSQVTKEILDGIPGLKFVATMSTGFDHVDSEECKRRGIVVSNVPVYAESVVAEHSFALLLSISRRILESVERVKKGNFSPVGLTGFELRGKTLGVIGVGAIGANMIRIAKGFGMNVVAFKRTPDLVMERELGFKFVDMDILYQQSDVISLHVPYNKETHHLLNEESFGKMKEGVIVLNTSRGGLIDNTALLKSLQSGKVKGAGLDVLEEEPLLQEEKELLSHEYDREQLMSVLENHMLVNNPNVVITPHNAFNSTEALRKIVATTHENISAFLSGIPINAV